MSKFKKTSTIAILFLLLTGISSSSCATQHEEEYIEDTLWEVFQAEPSLVESNLIWVEDKFRLKKPGNADLYQLKPLQKLRKRWGQSGQPNFYAVLHRVTTAVPADVRLYCGELNITIPGHPIEKHGLSLSYVSEDLVILEILHGDCKNASFKKSHGGLAHAERN